MPPKRKAAATAAEAISVSKKTKKDPTQTAAASKPRRTVAAPKLAPISTTTKGESEKKLATTKVASSTKRKPKPKPISPVSSNPNVSSSPDVSSSPESVKTDTSGSAQEESIEDEDDGERGYWLMKSEPYERMENGQPFGGFSIDHLVAADEPEPWDGVRNFAARNNLRSMMKGDLAFFYHSSCKVPGIAGIMEIVREHSIDDTAFDKAAPYHDPKSKPDNPKWFVVHVEARKKLDELISLTELKSYSEDGGILKDMQLLRTNRCPSVTKVSKNEWDFILTSLAGLDPETLEPKT